MTREEAIQILSTRDAHGVLCGYTSGVTEALDMAIEALSTESVSRETYHNLVTASNDIDRALREYQDKEENGELVSVVRCKDCKYFELDHFDRIDDMPIITAHEICTKWNGGCKTSKDGFCFMGERREP